MVPWVILLLAIAILLSIGIERLIARLGIERDQPTQPGLAVLAERLEQWSSRRMRQNQERDTED